MSMSPFKRTHGLGRVYVKYRYLLYMSNIDTCFIRQISMLSSMSNIDTCFICQITIIAFMGKGYRNGQLGISKKDNLIFFFFFFLNN